MSKQPDGLANKRLFGKRVTNKEMAIQIAKLYFGDMETQTSPLTQKEIAKSLGYKDEKSIKDYLNLAKELGLQKDKKNDYKLTDYKFLENMKDFTSSPCMQTWITDMKTRATGGKEFQGTQKHLTTFKIICDTLQVDPIQVITGGDRQTVLDNGEKYLIEFMRLYMLKKAKTRYKKTWTASKVGKSTQYSYAQTWRDFMRIHGYVYNKGKGGVLSQSITPFHGDYADVRLTMAEYRKAKQYIIEKWGLDSDIFRWFAIGIEALPRAKAIISMLNNYEVVKYKGKEFYSMSVIETKTSQYKGGKWKKLIFDSDTKESINLVKNRGCPYVIESYRSYADASKNIYPKLKEVYRFLNKTHLARRIADDEETSYFIAHPSHTLRHCGAQIWLYATKWSISFVASMGWKKGQELMDSYGEMPESMRLEVIGGANLD